MSVTVVFPWRGGDPYREQSFEYIRRLYQHYHPTWKLTVGLCDPSLPFNRSEAILDGAVSCPADLYVIADADVWCDPQPALDHARDETGWAIPHLMLVRLDKASSARYIDGNRADLEIEERYKGNETGTLVVMTHELLFDIPPDVRFVGWGQEDDAWAVALKCLHGPAWRGHDKAFHLWHPPQERMSRGHGNPAGMELCAHYRAAKRRPDQMRALIDEGKALWPAEWTQEPS